MCIAHARGRSTYASVTPIDDPLLWLNPIEKLYNVANGTLENKDCPGSKIQIEALVTDKICSSSILEPLWSDQK